LDSPTLALAHWVLRVRMLSQVTGPLHERRTKIFWAQWKDADPDIPILKQAKAEYAKLQ